MWTELNLDHWLDGNAASQEAAEYIRAVKKAPQRNVQGNLVTNVTTNFPSTKMGTFIQSESHTGERLLLLDLEYSKDVVAYWDQPVSVPIVGTSISGRTYRSRYTADYLALHSLKAVAYEVKPRSKIDALISERPKDWQRQGDSIIFHPARIAFGFLGIEHVVVVSDELSQIRAENISLLLNARARPGAALKRRQLARLARALQNSNAMRISELLSEIEHHDVTPLLVMIDDGRLFTNLDRYRLGKPDSAWISTTAEALASITRAIDGIFEFNTTSHDCSLPSSKKLKRIALRQSYLDDPASAKVCRATMWRYRKALSAAGGALYGLADQYENCGLRGSQLDPAHEALIKTIIEEYYCTPKQRSVSAVYSIYANQFLERQREEPKHFQGVPVVRKTFQTRIDQLDHATTALARGGRRAELAAADPTGPLLRSLSPCRAFASAHMDHWLAEYYVVVRRDGQIAFALRPWISFLIDTATEALLAFTISLCHPSRRTIARVLRDCARRHARLPESIITDAGAEFRSNFFYELLAHQMIEKFQRPVGAGRWGKEVERVFGLYGTVVLSAYAGHMKATKEDRGVSRSFRSDQQAVMEPIQLHYVLEDYTGRWFNSHARGTRAVAPCVLMRESLSSFSCSGIPVTLDDDFMIATSVPAAGGSYQVEHARGIRTQGQHYAPESLAEFNTGKIEDLRIDPENDTVVYAYSNRKWHFCYSGEARRRAANDRLVTLYETSKLREGQVALKEAKLQETACLGGLILDTEKQLLKRFETEPQPAQTGRRGRSIIITASSSVTPRPMRTGD